MARSFGLVRILFFLALTMALPVRADSLESPNDQRARQQIQQTFAEAQATVTQGERAGVTLLSLVSRDSRTRLDAVHMAARNGTAAMMGGLGPSEKLVVRALQVALTPAQLRRMSDAALIDHAVTQHWIRPEMIQAASLGNISLDGNRASAPLVLSGLPALVRVDFVRESADWRFDLRRSLEASDVLIRLLATLAGQSEDDYTAQLAARLRPAIRTP